MQQLGPFCSPVSSQAVLGLTAGVTVQLATVVHHMGSPYRQLAKLCTIESGSGVGKTHMVSACPSS